MKRQDIHTLVTRFFDGETTLEEERRLYAFFQREDVPNDLREYQEMFRGYAALAPKKARKHVLIPRWTRLTGIAAVCLVAISLISYTFFLHSPSKSQEERLAEAVASPVTKRTNKQVDKMTEEVKREVKEVEKPSVEATVKKVVKKELPPAPPEDVQMPVQTEEEISMPVEWHPVNPSPPEEGTLLYASSETLEDSTYQDPKRMEDFIVKFAAYHGVEQMPLDCSHSADGTVVTAAYLFPDQKEIDVFGRLLQAACWFDDATPGYHLSFSHLQFFFELRDKRKGLKYLWIADRINGKILLFSTHSPIGSDLSAECYRQLHERLMNIKSNNPNTFNL